MQFNERLQKLRKDRGLSQEKLSEILGVSRQAVAKWESAKSYPEIDKLILLSELFKVTIDKLIKDCDSNCCTNEEKFIDYSFENIVNFLCRAKKVTYAGSGEEEQPSSRPSSHDLHYEEENLKYIDTYLGGEKFLGEEALWQDNTPIWSMNYMGRVIDENFSGKFLKEALLLVSKDYPYRGPMIYKNGDYIYHCSVNGEFNWFNGNEEIYCNNKKVYECVFHGGRVK
ncbi:MULTISPECIES: DUF5680 domain-containing protein [Clostridium]|uniref:DUF5680 domain-containing protein n=1 Tax=Clostridium TaxID=1485 RepID=UPI0008264CF6|nr:MULTISPECIES: DUF5680 domain-containing protein [Clostridium]PJI10076.1 XRE family transcriptional regulator [Clostridium sp. CT7]